MKSEPAWHAEARAMRDQGMTSRQIGPLLGKNKSTIDRLLRDDGPNERREREERLLHAKRERAARAAAKERAAKRPDTMAIARLFAAGQIDRAELSRRLRGECRV